MNRSWKLMIRGSIAAACGMGLLTVYLAICLFAYGNNSGGWDLPEWFFAGYDYAVDETLLRAPILVAADLCSRRDWNEALSITRRTKAWLRQKGFSKAQNEAGFVCHHYDLKELDEHLRLQDDGIWGRLGWTRREEQVREPLLSFEKTWEEVRMRREIRRAETRCLE